MTDARTDLARRFARTLRHLRDAWQVHYVVRAPTRRGARDDAGIEGDGHVEAATPPADSHPLGDGPPRATALRAEAREWTAAQKLEYLRSKNLGDCQRCPLSRTRSNIVFGVGDPQARLMFVGEAPGADEDRQGEPFVGRAGQRLTRWIETLGLSRQRVYIANVLKCRPPGNRDPQPAEVDKCSPFLRAQIRAIQPAVIVALGRHAGMLLHGQDLTLHAMRTRALHYDVGEVDGASLRIPLLVTYHPAWVLRQEGSEASRGRADADATVLGDLRKALSIAYPDGGP